MGDEVWRQERWKALTQQLLESVGQRGVRRETWLEAAAMIQARENEGYSLYANILPDFLGWKPNNKPSWELAHPMGMMAAQWVRGTEYWCRCVKDRQGGIIAVRDGVVPHWVEAEERDQGVSDPTTEEVGENEEPDLNNLMQKTLTSMMNQQGRTRLVLQGVNFRLSNTERRTASRRAKAILSRLVLRFSISHGTRMGLHELVQDAEATLAGHVEDGPPHIETTDEDVVFVRGWCGDLLAALEHDIHEAAPLPFQCITGREQQEMERGMEEDQEQAKAEAEWEDHMQQIQAAQGELATSSQPTTRAVQMSSREYQTWEDWALWDEMNGPERHLRKRKLRVQVRVGGGSSSSTSVASCDLPGWDGRSELSISLSVEPMPELHQREIEEGGSSGPPRGMEGPQQESDHPSEASTVAVPQLHDGPTERPHLQDGSAERPDREVCGPGTSSGEGVAPTVMEPEESSTAVNVDDMETLPWGEQGLGTITEADLEAIDEYARDSRGNTSRLPGMRHKESTLRTSLLHGRRRYWRGHTRDAGR